MAFNTFLPVTKRPWLCQSYTAALRRREFIRFRFNYDKNIDENPWRFIAINKSLGVHHMVEQAKARVAIGFHLV